MMENRSRSIVVLGAGGHAKVIIATLESLGWAVTGVFDDDSNLWNTCVLGHPVLGSISKALENQQTNAVIAIGSNHVRKKLAAQCQFTWPTIVHPFTWVAPSARLGPGTVVLAGAVVQPDAQVGAHCIVNTSASVDHDCFVSDYIHLCPGVRLTGGVSVGEGATIGSGAVVLPYKSLGSWAVVGAGSVVNRDCDANSTVVGVPGRIVSLKSDKR